MKFKKLGALILGAILTVGIAAGLGSKVENDRARAQEDLIYTLTPATGSNNNYANNCDIEIDGITWNLTGNSQMIPWRIGGKSLSKVSRTLYSKTAITENVSKIELDVGAASSITVNSLTLKVGSKAKGDDVSVVGATFKTNSTITFNRPEEGDWSNVFYNFDFNVTVSGSSNKFLEVREARFYGEVGGSSESSEPSPEEPTSSTQPGSETSSETATLTFDNKSKRTEYSSDIQVWKENGVTFTNNKSSSTNSVADYAAPVRLYANSSIKVSVADGNLTEIIFDCNNSSYATVMKNSIGDSAAADSDKVTVGLDGTSNSFSVSKLTAQIRLDAITVTYSVSGSGNEGGDDNQKTLTSISINGELTKTTYSISDNWNNDGLSVLGTYSDTTEDSINEGITWSYNPATPSDMGITENGSLTITASVEGVNPVSIIKKVKVIEPESFNLVTNVNVLKAGLRVAIAANSSDNNSYALSTNQKTNNRAAVAVNAKDNSIEINENVQIFTLEEGTIEGTFAFNTGSGYIYAAASSDNYLKTQDKKDDNGSWNITISSDGLATVVAQGANTRNVLKFNYNNGSPLFAAYENTLPQTLVSIYSEPIVEELPTEFSVSDVHIPLGSEKAIEFNVTPNTAVIKNATYTYDETYISINENHQITFKETLPQVGTKIPVTVSIQGKNENLETNFNIIVDEPTITAISFSGLNNFIANQPLNDDLGSTISLSNTSGTPYEMTLSEFYNIGGKVTINGIEINYGGLVLLEYNQTKIQLSLGDVKSQNRNITVIENVQFDVFTPSWETSGYIIRTNQNTIDFQYSNFNIGTVSVSSSHPSILNAALDGEVTQDGCLFSGKIALTPADGEKEGQTEIRITVRSGDTTISKHIVVVLLNSEESTTSDFNAVNQFVKAHMRHDEISRTVSEGNCGEYYESVKNAYNNLTSEQKDILKTKFELSFDRLSAWASANGDEFVDTDENGLILQEQQSALVNIINQETTFVIVLIALVSLSAFAFVYVAKRKQRKIEL